MSSLVVGNLLIRVAPSGIKRDRLDGVDRARAFDQTYRASVTGNPKRDWFFSTAPVPRGTADGYELALSSLVALPCSGDIIGGGRNDLLWSRDLSDAASAAWIKTTMTVTHNQIGIDGVANSASALIAAAGNATVSQQITVASGSRQMSAWVFRGIGSGVIQMTVDANAGDWVTINPTAEWQRFSVPAKTLSVSSNSGFRIVTSGDAIAVDYAQNEPGTQPTAPTLTTTAAVNNITPVNCIPEIVGWTPVKTNEGHRVVGEFILHEV